jgi:2-polyprenyl-3-methyl-5-hydroxy-6-metoxy-1,4-benzoquinol methylase
MDVEHLTLAPQSFDGVTILEILEHPPHPELGLRSALLVALR